jgi:hypothetical protein
MASIIGPPLGLRAGLYNQITWGASALTPPGSPLIWFDAQNIDGTNNSSLIDGQSIGTWTNLGSLGATGNAVQATAGLKPIFRLVAAAGKINNKSAVEFTAANSSCMATTTFAGQGTTIYYAAIVKAKTSQGAGGWIVDGFAGNRQQWGFVALQHRLFSASGAPTTGQTIALNTWQSVGAQFSGTSTSSFSRQEGVSSALVDTSPGASLTNIALGCGAGGAATFDGFIEELLVYVGTPSIAPIEAYLTAKVGTTPQ